MSSFKDDAETIANKKFKLKIWMAVAAVVGAVILAAIFL